MQTKIKSLFINTPKAVWVSTGIILLALLLTAGILAVVPEITEEPQEETQPASGLVENPYDAESFAYAGEYLTCIAGTSTLGIDVSEWQGEIDWQQVKAAGVEFVILRLGWRGSQEGVLARDEYMQTYYDGAKSAGLRVGGYFFSQAIHAQEAEEEAEYLLEQIKGWQLDMPIAYDWEHISDDYRTAAMDARTLTDCVIAFCQRLELAGYEAMIYFNPDHAAHRLYLEELTDYDFWFAMYDHPMDFPYRVDMWQYTATGFVPGIEGDVDINLHFTYEES